jgi:hypothetical protein
MTAPTTGKLVQPPLPNGVAAIVSVSDAPKKGKPNAIKATGTVDATVTVLNLDSLAFTLKAHKLAIDPESTLGQLFTYFVIMPGKAPLKNDGTPVMYKDKDTGEDKRLIVSPTITAVPREDTWVNEGVSPRTVQCRVNSNKDNGSLFASTAYGKGDQKKSVEFLPKCYFANIVTSTIEVALKDAFELIANRLNPEGMGRKSGKANTAPLPVEQF